MSNCGSNKFDDVRPLKAAAADCCNAATVACRSKSRQSVSDHFENMISNCLEYAGHAKANGTPIVGIMCEYTPREIILAAGALPVCLCGGSAATITAAEKYLPANLCPLIKSTYGYSVLKQNPFLEMADLIVAETTCDGKKKMYELLGKSHQMMVLELPQKPLEIDAGGSWMRHLQKFKTDLEAKFSVVITDDKLRRAIAVMNHERKLRRDLASLMASDAPPLTGLDLLKLRSTISGIERDLHEYTDIYRRLNGKTDAANVGKMRVLLTGVPITHGAHRVVELIESHNALVVCMENCTGLKPILEDIDESALDPLEALAKKYLNIPCSVMTPNIGRLESIKQLAARFRPDCVIDLIWQCCLTYDVESYLLGEFVKNQLGLPYLRIETDYYPADSARISLRLEALFETINKPAAKKCCG